MPARRFLLLFNTPPRCPCSCSCPMPQLPASFLAAVIALVKTLIKGELGQALGGVFFPHPAVRSRSGCQPALALASDLHLHLATPQTPPHHHHHHRGDRHPGWLPSHPHRPHMARAEAGQFERTMARGWAAAIKQLWHESDPKRLRRCRRCQVITGSRCSDSTRMFLNVFKFNFIESVVPFN